MNAKDAKIPMPATLISNGEAMNHSVKGETRLTNPSVKNEINHKIRAISTT